MLINAIVANCSAGHVRTVRIGPLRLGGAGYIKPVVVVVEAAISEVAAVLVDQRLVRVTGAGVGNGNNNTVAFDVIRPNLRGANLFNVGGHARQETVFPLLSTARSHWRPP